MPNWLFDPLWKGPSRVASSMADYIDPPAGEGGRLRGFLAGATEGAGDVLSGMTSPASIAGMLAGPAIGRLGGGLRSLSGLRGLSSLGKLEPATAPMEHLIDNSANMAEIYEKLGPEFVPVGGEEISRALRGAGSGARQVGQYIGDATRRSLPIGGEGLDVADMMSRVRR